MFSGFFVLTSEFVLAAGHPDSGSKCVKCHEYNSGSDDAPKAIPERPGFWARMLGEKPIQGHPSISCAGVVGEDGSLTGCHRPEDKNRKFLAMNLDKKPVDELCGKCHSEQREPGAHHPTYKSDKDSDGVPETVVRPVDGQEIFSKFSPSAKSEPLRSHPDSVVFIDQPDGTRILDVVLPLETVVELGENQEQVEYKNTVTCTTCHNPHYGYFAGAGSEADLNKELVAREAGDALLRMKDFDNSLCDACH